MKKVIALLTVILICFSLCACDPGSFSKPDDAFENVVSIELIEYHNPNQKKFSSWVFDQSDRLQPFVLSQAQVLETLPEERIPEFLDTFAETDILNKYYAYDSPANVCIKINYSSGAFLIIWSNYKNESYAGYIGLYEADGTVSSFWGSFSSLEYYEDLVDDFFNYDL